MLTLTDLDRACAPAGLCWSLYRTSNSRPFRCAVSGVYRGKAINHWRDAAKLDDALKWGVELARGVVSEDAQTIADLVAIGAEVSP